MATHNFEHLPLLLRYQGRARIYGGGKTSPQTVANRGAAQAHATYLLGAVQALAGTWQQRRAQRQAENLPEMPPGTPILLQVDPGLDLDFLREKFAFEIVAEQEDGYVIVATEDIDVPLFMAMVNEFSVDVHGSATIAKIHSLDNDATLQGRLSRVLSERLLEAWPAIADDQMFIVDVGIACTGAQDIPKVPKRGKRDDDAKWAAKQLAWEQARNDAYDAWDAVKIDRENQIEGFRAAYQAEILRNLHDDGGLSAGILPDSFTIRIRIRGQGLKDFILNYPYIFEVLEPEDIILPQNADVQQNAAGAQIAPVAPHADAPAVCVVDSGLQEGHPLLLPAVDQASSHCFLPGEATTAVADGVAPSGHGTRVAGAVLYGESIPTQGTPQLPYWVQNARVLNSHNSMPVELFPPEAIRDVVERFNDGARATRIFNHSINSHGYCRTRYMSSWAAEIDQLCNERDVLIVQSAGNLPDWGDSPFLGIGNHLTAGRAYPQFLSEKACRVANPAQSLQALTVGSIAYGTVAANGWQTFADKVDAPSAFSRTGPGIWGVTKPEVVEYGGDAIRTANDPPDLHGGGLIPQACPPLVRSTLHGAGPATSRDATGTSFASPKVARIAAEVQRNLPNEPALLYRALIVQSARWPAWAEATLTQLRNVPPGTSEAEKLPLFAEALRSFRSLGYGIPDIERATANTDFRTTMITSGETAIRASEGHIYQVPVPAALRQPGDEFQIRIDVTLSYVARPRRTRRNLRRYLSTWVEWKSSKLGESLINFQRRALTDEIAGEAGLGGGALPWTLQTNPKSGLIREVRRNSGTVQKDWAIVRSNQLPDHFCIAVVGHQGWSHDPDSTARYTLAVTFEILGQEVSIYDPLRVAIAELQAEVEEIEAEAEVEIDDEE